MPCKNLTEQIWHRVRSEVAEQIRACASAIEEHRKLFEELARRGLLPGDAKRLLQYFSEQPISDSSPAGLESRADILAKLRAIEQSQLLQSEACRSVNAVYLQAESAVVALVQAATKSLDTQVAELTEIERAFFAEHGFPHESTAISRLAVSLKGEISADAFNRGKEAILNNPSSDYAPQLNLASLKVLLQG
jgi:hypothetical protein